MFKNLKIGTRLGLGFGLVLVQLCIISFVGISRMESVKKNMDFVVHVNNVKIALANSMRGQLNVIARSVRNLALLSDVAEMKKEEALMQEARTQYGVLRDKLEKMVVTSEGRKMFAAINEAQQRTRPLVDQTVALGLDNKDAEATALLMKEVRPAQNKWFDAIQAMVERFESQNNKMIEESSQAYENAYKLMLILSITSVLLGVFVAYQVTRGITRPLDEAVAVANQLAEGDLTAKIVVNSRDETGMLLTAMQDMVVKLKEMINAVLSSTDQVSGTAVELSASSGQVAEGSRQQAEAASSMAAAMEQMMVSIEHVSNNAQDARSSSGYSGDLSEQGAKVIQNAVLEMVKIEGSVKESSKIIGALEQHSGEITAIVNVIKDIADQTNLLALNAAIEAARAGEQGRGFAVVADEVRKLAERTAKSTQEIAGMIEKIQVGTRDAVASMENGVTQVSGGVALANQAGESITQIQAQVARVVQAVGDISDSLKEQNTAGNDIAKNVEKIAQMSEENSAAVQQTASAAQHLEQLASSLQGAIGRFKV
ncbi:MAG: methyl-accepting chemotaxis protein [Betaproteobacteria bacterium]|nr:methyl-accepting chemotaxis protein [Betaproteobacteria bacterium]